MDLDWRAYHDFLAGQRGGFSCTIPARSSCSGWTQAISTEDLDSKPAPATCLGAEGERMMEISWKIMGKYWKIMGNIIFWWIFSRNNGEISRKILENHGKYDGKLMENLDNGGSIFETPEIVRAVGCFLDQEREWKKDLHSTLRQQQLHEVTVSNPVRITMVAPMWCPPVIFCFNPIKCIYHRPNSEISTTCNHVPYIVKFTQK